MLTKKTYANAHSEVFNTNTRTKTHTHPHTHTFKRRGKNPGSAAHLFVLFSRFGDLPSFTLLPLPHTQSAKVA